MPVTLPEIKVKLELDTSYIEEQIEEFVKALALMGKAIEDASGKIFQSEEFKKYQEIYGSERTEEVLMAGFTPIRKGVDPRKDSRGIWLTIEPNSFVDAVSLVDTDDIISHDQCAIWGEVNVTWSFTGTDDPSHELGVQKQERFYLPVLVNGEQKIWSMSKTLSKQIWEISESASGGLKGQVIRIKREGSGLSTRYTIIPRGKKMDVSGEDDLDVISHLGPLDAAGVRELLEEKFSMPYAALVKKLGGKAKEAEKKSKKAAAEAFSEEKSADDDFAELEADE